MPCKIIIHKTNVNNWLNATTYLFSESYALIIFCFFQADASNDYTSRFLGFSLYISNTTNKSEGALCFQDINFNRSTIPDVFSTKCTEKGQYVIFYNERLPEVNYSADFSTYAFADICEIEVYGKYLIVHKPCALLTK